MEVEAIATLVSTFGFWGIFVYIYLRNGKRHIEEMKDKTDRIRELTTERIESAKTVATLASQVTEALKGNTRALDRLVGRIDDLSS